MLRCAIVLFRWTTSLSCLLPTSLVAFFSFCRFEQEHNVAIRQYEEQLEGHGINLDDLGYRPLIAKTLNGAQIGQGLSSMQADTGAHEIMAGPSMTMGRA